MPKYKLVYSKAFENAIKKLRNDKKAIELIKIVLKKLANNEKLESKYKDHKLKGEYKDFRECHIKPDLLLIYQKQEELLILKAIDIGSHSELF